MSMIRGENLSFSYPSSYDTIFENVDFQIDTAWVYWKKRQRKNNFSKSPTWEV